jgi:hypothetical protein
MTYLEFLAQIADAPALYIGLLILFLAAYLCILRKHLLSIFDPLLLAGLFSAFGTTDVAFMWSRDLIDTTYVIQFAATEGAFLAGLLLVTPAKWEKVYEKGVSRSNTRFLSSLYIVSSITFIVFQLATYAIHGIPIFYASRLDYYSSGGGLGALDRVLDITWYLTCYLLLYRYAYRIKIEGWPGLFDTLIACSLACSSILSGSKSTYILALFAIFYFRLFHKRELEALGIDGRFAKLQKLLIATSVAAAALVIAITISSGGMFAFAYQMYMRLVSSGDAFFMAYPSHVIDSIPDKQAFYALFGGILVMFRLVPVTSLPENLGFQLYRGVYGFDASVGPNPRHNIFGYVYFGFAGAIIYSLVLGIVISIIRNRLATRIRAGGVIEPIFVFLAISSVSMITDFAIFMKDVGSVILVVPVLYAIAAIMAYVTARREVSTQVADTDYLVNGEQ